MVHVLPGVDAESAKTETRENIKNEEASEASGPHGYTIEFLDLSSGSLTTLVASHELWIMRIGDLYS